MRHHKKSNQGRFSKKQKKASRTMMMMRRGGFSKKDPQGLDVPLVMKGFLPAMISMLFRRRG